MKQRVSTIHGKVIVTGGENPENELRSHEILLNEKPDGTVELKERNIHGEVVSIAGGGSDSGSSAVASIKFYYVNDTNADNYESNLQEAEIAFGGSIPRDSNDSPLWRDPYYSVDYSYFANFSYYLDSSNIAHDIEESFSFNLNDDPTDEEITAKIVDILNPYGKDLNFLYYCEGTNGCLTTRLHEMTNSENFGNAQCIFAHYDHKSNTIEKLYKAAFVVGLLTTMQ